ncbi:hypothetical protein AMECASPLE_038174 [Ameca splendens]|uniref:Uncharacterized protein n=1 Tax=Ameca splendens TaxID=208324 RepID=A0ABV0XL80_9TELE
MIRKAASSFSGEASRGGGRRPPHRSSVFSQGPLSLGLDGVDPRIREKEQTSCDVTVRIKTPLLQQTDLFHAGPQRNWMKGHSTLMSLCWQADITLQTGSKSVIRSGDHMH